MLVSNLKYLRKKRNETQGQVADALSISRSTYADYEGGRTEPNASLLLKIAEYYKTDLNSLMTTDLGIPLFKSDAHEKSNSNSIRILPITIGNNSRENIELVPVNAIAGYSSDFDKPQFIEELPRFSLPGLQDGTYRAFEISGTSMPPLNEGFIVVGKYLENWEDFKSGKRYIIVLKHDGILFKRVVNEVAKTQKLILYSDNPEFLPNTISVTDVLEAWEMVSYIGFPSKNIDMNEVIFNKLQYLEHKLNDLSPLNNTMRND